MVLRNMLRGLAYPFRILRSSRPPISVNARTQLDKYGQAQYQGVRFQAWRSRPRNLLFPFFAAGAMYEVWRWTVLRPLDNLGNELDEALKDLPEEDRRKLEEEMEETAFFPFPFTTNIIQPGPYSRLDPEIAEYRKIFETDKALKDQIHKAAAPWVAEHLPEHDHRFSRMKLKPWHAWVDVRHQELPPPYYTQSGLEIGGEAPFISWETFQVEPEVAQRLERVLYPLPAAKAMWNYLRVAFTLGDANEKAGEIATEHMRLPTGYKVTLQQLVAATPEGRKQLEKQREENRKKAADMAMRLVEEQNKTIDTKMKTSEDGSVSQPPSETSRIPSFGQNENNGQTSEKQPTTIADFIRKTKEGSWSPEDNEELRQYLLTVPGVQSYIQIAKRFEYATAIFKLTFQKENKPMVCPPPRGAVEVSGLFLMTIPNGWVILDVDMHWDPKTKTFDENSFSAKTLKMRVNKPPVTGVQMKTLSSPRPEAKK